MLSALLLALLLAFATPFISHWTAKYIAEGRRARAFGRIRDEPLLRVGTMLARVELQGHPQPLLGRCRIETVEVGRVVLRCQETGDLLPITGVELEQLWPIVAEHNGRARDRLDPAVQEWPQRTELPPPPPPPPSERAPTKGLPGA